LALRLLRRHTALQKLRQCVSRRRHRGLLPLAVLLGLLPLLHAHLLFLLRLLLLLQLPLVLKEGRKPCYIESGHSRLYIVKP
jgi:hypothetical protein